MQFIVPAALVLVAVIHALPLVGVVSGARVARLYGVTVQDPNIEILLRHRAVLFGLLAAFLAHAAFEPTLHGLGIVAGSASVGTFIALARGVGGFNGAMARVVRADVVAAVALAAAAVAHFAAPAQN